jgi:hypothetical protein
MSDTLAPDLQAEAKEWRQDHTSIPPVSEVLPPLERTCFLDTETRSRVDLGDAGAYRYACDETTSSSSPSRSATVPSALSRPARR